MGLMYELEANMFNLGKDDVLLPTFQRKFGHVNTVLMFKKPC